jgi:4-amino-4-deoxy-L-arabinose transferase-like glycosyltransferase
VASSFTINSCSPCDGERVQAGATTLPIAASSTSQPRRGSRAVWWSLLGIMAISLAVECWALQRDLPFSDVDEPTFVRPAVHIAATGDLDPHWFGHPGSTIIYPVAGFYRAWDTLAHGGPVFSSSPGLAHRFLTSPTEFYVIGRLWSIAFAVGALPVIFLLGRRCFSTAVGLVSASLWAIVPLMVRYGREVRTDSAGVFFVLLSLLLIVRLLDRPSLPNHALAGGSVGLGISSRYFLVMLVPVLIAAGVIAIRRRAPGATIRGITVGLGAALAAFALTTPYFFLDWSTARHSLAVENAPSVAHAGFSPLGNFRWYLWRSIPATISWPVVLLAVGGVVLVLMRHRAPRRLLLLAAGLLFLIAISTSKLHWSRWPLPILPVAVLFAAYALVVGATAVQAAVGRTVLAPTVVAGLALVSVIPAKGVIVQNRLDARPSTRVVAREWIKTHVPAGSTVVRELKTAPLKGIPLRETYRPALPIGGWTLDRYRRDGVQYLITNAGMSGPYTTHPRRYPREAHFYRELRRQACLLHEFHPNSHRGGPIIRVYELVPTGMGCGTSTNF